MYTSHIFIDLEMNPISREFPEEKEACRAEVIEIGAVRLDADYNLTDRFTLFVRPRYSTELNRHVAKLTGIKVEDLQDAPDFREAMEIFTDWVGTGNIRFYSWSMSDWWQLADEGELKLGELPDIFYESRCHTQSIEHLALCIARMHVASLNGEKRASRIEILKF